MREPVLADFRSNVRRVLNEHLRLPASSIVEITNKISAVAIPAIDQEVEFVARTCGLIPADEFGGSFA